MEILLIILGVLAVVGSLIGISIWMDRKRRDELQKVADELGLEFHLEGSSELTARMANFALFNAGRGRKLTKLILGESEEVKISIFDYRYTTGSGKHSQTHQQSVAALHSPELKIPDFTLRAEYMWDKLGSLMGMTDINFESHPGFSKMFVLKGSRESAVRKLFKPPVLEFFEQHKGVSVEAVPGAMIFYRPGRRIAPRDIKEFLAQAYQVYGVMVDNV